MVFESRGFLFPTFLKASTQSASVQIQWIIHALQKWSDTCLGKIAIYSLNSTSISSVNSKNETEDGDILGYS